MKRARSPHGGCALFSWVRPAGRTCLSVNMNRSRVSLMTALQREGLAEGQPRDREVLVGRKPMAKRWPDEQEPQRRACWIRGPIIPKSKVCTEGMSVMAAGISAKAGASYLGRPVWTPERARVVETRCEVRAGVSRGHSSPRSGVKGRT